MSTDSTEPTSAGPNAPKKRGRPKGSKNTVKAENVPQSDLVTAMQAQIAELEAKLAAKAPPPQDAQRPGTYVVTGTDPAGRPMYTKVRYTRQWVEANYPMVDFVPAGNPVDSLSPTLKVAPLGVQYVLKINQLNHVPSIVKDTYDNLVKSVEDQKKRYARWTSAELDGYDAAAQETGTRVYSRVARIGTGFQGLGPDADPTPSAPEPTAA